MQNLRGLKDKMELKDIENESQRRYGMGYEELMTPEQDQITMNPAETQEDPFRKDSRKDKIKEWILRGLTKDQIIDRLMEGFAMNREDAEQMYLDEAISGTVGKTIRILKGEQLPIYKIRGKYYYRDTRLGEYRNVKDINDRIPIDDVSLEDLETPGKEDQQEVYGKKLKKEWKVCPKCGSENTRLLKVRDKEGLWEQLYCPDCGYEEGDKGKPAKWMKIEENKSIEKATKKIKYREYILIQDGDAWYIEGEDFPFDTLDEAKEFIDEHKEKNTEKSIEKLKKDKKLDAIHDALVREGKAEDPWALAQWIRQHNKSWDDINKYLENMKAKQKFIEEENTGNDPFIKEDNDHILNQTGG
jgi:predicted RNA-binding Zn-ribbon protein involved in translation (DUF1610 family)